MLIDIKSILQRTKLFNHLSDIELTTLSTRVTTVKFQAGDTIISEGDIGDNLYVIVYGVVRVFTFDKDGKEISVSKHC